MDEINKKQFLENFEGEFEGNDENGYIYKGFFVSASEIKDATNRMVSDWDEFLELIEKNNDEDIQELNNYIMAYIFGDGDVFQGSYEEIAGNGEYNWYLDFGKIIINKKNEGFKYTNVRFYKGYEIIKREIVKESVASREKRAIESLSPNELKELAKDEDEDVCFKLAGNVNTPVEALEDLVEKWPRLRKVVAANVNAPVPLLEKLAGVEDGDEWNYDIREAVAGNKNAPKRLLEKLRTDVASNVRAAVSKNKNTPMEMLEKLTEDEDGFVRGAVAENMSASASILEKLAADENEYVRTGVAKNWSTSASILEKMATDEDEFVRGAVAENEKVSIPLLEKLAIDKEDNVRQSVATNKSSPTELLEKMVEDETVLYYLAENVNAPISLLEKLAELPGDKYEAVRRNVAVNNSTPILLLEKLAEDEDEYVRCWAARNENMPACKLEELAGDEQPTLSSVISTFHL